MGRDVWSAYSPDATIVLTHPNVLDPHSHLEAAAIAAGLISKGKVDKRLHCIDETTAASWYFVCKNPEAFARSPVRAFSILPHKITNTRPVRNEEDSSSATLVVRRSRSQPLR